MAKILGLGGVFLQVSDPAGYRAWYKKALGAEITDWGTLEWEADGAGRTMMSPFESDSTYFAPSLRKFMINLRVDDVAALIDSARSHGAQIIGQIEDTEFGIFGWFIDPEGLKIELWQEPSSG
jgi:predicted enzyme related to lactoylglutathione lyase